MRAAIWNVDDVMTTIEPPGMDFKNTRTQHYLLSRRHGSSLFFKCSRAGNLKSTNFDVITMLFLRKAVEKRALPNDLAPAGHPIRHAFTWRKYDRCGVRPQFLVPWKRFVTLSTILCERQLTTSFMTNKMTHVKMKIELAFRTLKRNGEILYLVMFRNGTIIT